MKGLKEFLKTSLVNNGIDFLCNAQRSGSDLMSKAENLVLDLLEMPLTTYHDTVLKTSNIIEWH